MREYRLLNFGVIGYAQALDLQKKIVDEVIFQKAPHTLIVCRHPHTVTLSRRSNKENLLVEPSEFQRLGLEIFSTDRGGDVTYHGPGQVVVYPIFDLRQDKRDLHLYLRNLEEIIIRPLRDRYGLNAYHRRGFTGVWVGPYKVASIGIAVRHWVAYHGIALNVSVDKKFFSLIRSCGLDAKMASLNDFFYEAMPLEEAEAVLVESFENIFNLKLLEEARI